MATNNAPWNWQVPVVQISDGTASSEFIYWLNQQLATYKVASAAVPQTRSILTGLGLSGGGDLSADRTIVLSAVLGNLTDIDVSTPPTNGQTLTWSSATSKWKPAAAGGALEVDQNGTLVLVPVTKINFTGGGVVVTTPVAGQVNVAIAGGGASSSIWSPLSNGDTPGPVLIDNGVGACVIVDIS